MCDTERKLIFNMTRGQNRADVVLTGIDNGSGRFDLESLGLNLIGNISSLGEFKICREGTFQVLKFK